MSPEHIEEFGTALAHHRKLGIVAELHLDRIGSSEEADAVQAAAVEAYGGAPCGYSIQGTTALSQPCWSARFSTAEWAGRGRGGWR